MKIKIFTALALLIMGGSAMAFVAVWNPDSVLPEPASDVAMFSQFEMIFLWLSGLIGLWFARRKSNPGPLSN